MLPVSECNSIGGFRADHPPGFSQSSLFTCVTAIVVVIVSLAAVTLPGIAFGENREDFPDLETALNGNRDRLWNLFNVDHPGGMITREQVLAAMGTETVNTADGPLRNPYRRELYQWLSKGETVELLIYQTDKRVRSGAVTEDDLTPIIIANGIAIGRGWEAWRPLARVPDMLQIEASDQSDAEVPPPVSFRVTLLDKPRSDEGRQVVGIGTVVFARRTIRREEVPEYIANALFSAHKKIWGYLPVNGCLSIAQNRAGGTVSAPPELVTWAGDPSHEIAGLMGYWSLPISYRLTIKGERLEGTREVGPIDVVIEGHPLGPVVTYIEGERLPDFDLQRDCFGD